MIGKIWQKVGKNQEKEEKLGKKGKIGKKKRQKSEGSFTFTFTTPDS